MPKISAAQGPSHAPEPVSPDQPGPDEPFKEGGSTGDAADPVDQPDSVVDRDVTVDYDCLTEDDETEDDDGQEFLSDFDGDTEDNVTIVRVAVPSQNAPKADWEAALRAFGVCDDWLTGDEYGRGRSKADLVQYGHALRDGELVVDSEGVPQPADS